MGILKQLVDMYKEGDKVAILYSTTSGRTSMIHEDAYEIEEYHRIMQDGVNLETEKEIIVDSAEHLEFAEARKLSRLPGKVILLFDQVGGINGLTIDQLRTLGFVILVPPENTIHAAGGDAFDILQTLMNKVIARRTGHIKVIDSLKTKVVPQSKLNNPLIISNDYDILVTRAIHKDMSAIGELAMSIDGIGKKTANEISALKYEEIEKYADTLKADPAQAIKHMLNAIKNEDAYALSKLTGKQITLRDALFGKAIGIKGANAKNKPDAAFFHTFDEVLVDLQRYNSDGVDEYDESYALRLYYAITRATGAVAFSDKVDKSIIEIEKQVVKAE